VPAAKWKTAREAAVARLEYVSRARCFLSCAQYRRPGKGTDANAANETQKARGRQCTLGLCYFPLSAEYDCGSQSAESL